MTHRLLAAVEAAAFRGLMALPRPLMRLLAGRPVILDGQVLDLETQWMLRLQRLLREPGPETLPIPEGRKALLRQARLAGGRQGIGTVRDLDVPGADGPVRARLYVPRESATAAGGRPAAGGDPLLVFLHGGGMVYGDLDSHDAPCRFLAERAAVRVLSVDYRLAPEHRFPAAVADCWAAYQWVAEHADELGADPERLAVGGDSAGAYLGAVVALRAAEAGVPCAFQLLVYPVTNMADPSESRRLFAEGFYLTSRFIEVSESAYLAPGEDRRDPAVSVQFVEKIPAGLAAAFVVTAGYDPLRDEGEVYARRLADAGTAVELKRYPGMIHGFVNVVGVGRSSRAAVAEIAAKLKAALHP
jgi:acetyl esterase